MHALEALQDEHEVTLLTLTPPDVPALNEYFSTDADPDEVRIAGTVAPALYEYAGASQFYLASALLARWVRDHADEYDLLVSTVNELGLGPSAIQYVHYPFDWLKSLSSGSSGFNPTLDERPATERVLASLAGVTPEELAQNTVFANSEWTARAVQRAYGVAPQVLFPPVDTGQFDPVPWSERESGFVAVGRIEESKRVDLLMEIVDGVREVGHDVHLHVVGPESKALDPAYGRLVREMAAERDYVFLEGECTRERLVELMTTHRYGLHGKREEHFGMAVAELAAAGTIPFVPDDGGQRGIVGSHLQRFTSADDAVRKIDEVLGDESLQRRLRPGKRAIERRFGRERFHEALRAAAAAALDGRTGVHLDFERAETTIPTDPR